MRRSWVGRRRRGRGTCRAGRPRARRARPRARRRPIAPRRSAPHRARTGRRCRRMDEDLVDDEVAERAGVLARSDGRHDHGRGCRVPGRSPPAPRSSAPGGGSGRAAPTGRSPEAPSRRDRAMRISDRAQQQHAGEHRQACRRRAGRSATHSGRRPPKSLPTCRQAAPAASEHDGQQRRAVGPASAAGFARTARRRSGCATSSAPATRRRRWRRRSPAACWSARASHGTLVASMRWSTSDSIVGASASQAPTPSDRADRRAATMPVSGAAGEHRQPDVALAAADRRQHAVLGHPALGDHREAGGGDQRRRAAAPRWSRAA